MEKDEIDQKVKELARSGGNPALRGVMFANMYIKIKAYDSAMGWLDKFLTIKGRDADAYSLYGDCHMDKGSYQKALDCYKRSLECRPRQPALALKVADMLVRRKETRNLSSAKIWIPKAENFNQGSIELYEVRRSFLEQKLQAKEIEPMEIERLIHAQIRQTPRCARIYIDLLQHFKSQNMTDSVASQIRKLESDAVSRTVLMGSVEWLEETAKYSKDKSGRLVKQIILCNLKLQRQIIDRKDLLLLDTYLLDFNSDGQLKKVGTKLLIFALAFIEPTDQLQAVLLHQSLSKPATISGDLPNKHLIREIDSSKIAIATAFLTSPTANPTAIEKELKLQLSGEEQRIRLAEKLLPKSNFLSVALTPDDCKVSDITVIFDKVVSNFGINLDALVWTFAVGNVKPSVVQEYVKLQFSSLIGTTSDANQISQYDIEAFLVAAVTNIDVNDVSRSLPGGSVVRKKEQREFWDASILLYKSQAMKTNMAQLRRTLKNGKNVIRLAGRLPSVEIVAAIGKHFAVTHRPAFALKYFEAIENQIIALSRDKAILGSKVDSTFLGDSPVLLNCVSAAEILSTIATVRGNLKAEEGQIEEAISFYESANTAESFINAASMIRDLDGADDSNVESLERALNFCSKAKTLKPDHEQNEMLQEVESELADVLNESKATHYGNGTLNGSTLNGSTVESLYSTPAVRWTPSRSSKTKELESTISSMNELLTQSNKKIEELTKNCQSNADNIRQLTNLITNLLVTTQPMMMQHMAAMGMPRQEGMMPQGMVPGMMPRQMMPRQMAPGEVPQGPQPVRLGPAAKHFENIQQQMRQQAMQPRPQIPPCSGHPTRPILHQAQPAIHQVVKPAPMTVPVPVQKPVPVMKLPEPLRQEPPLRYSTPTKTTELPKFSFKLKDGPSAFATKPMTGGFLSSTPARPNSGPFSFKSPQQMEKENAKLEKDEREAEGQDGDVGPHFEPVIPLPDLVEVKTGEEDEETAFSSRAKLYRWADGQWKERGLGEVKILKNPKSGKYRILMRREQVLKICANHLIQPSMSLKPMSGKDTAWVWNAMDNNPEEGKEHEIILEQFAIRFKTADIAKDFEKAFILGINASSPKTIKKATITKSPASKPSGKFDISGGSNSGVFNPFKLTNAPAPPVAPPKKEEAVEKEDADHDPHFEPIVQLEEVELSTGEEDEEVVFVHRAKLYRYDGEWKERGLGDIKILRHRATNKARVIMRREQVMKICANHFLAPEMSLTKMDGNEATRIWLAMDCSMEEDDPNSIQRFCARFKTAETAKEFENVFEKCKTAARPIATATRTIAAKPKPAVEQPKQEERNYSGLKSNLAAIFTKKPEELVKPEPIVKPEEKPKQNLFAGVANAMKSTGFGSSPGSGFSFSFNKPKDGTSSGGFNFGKPTEAEEPKPTPVPSFGGAFSKPAESNEPKTAPAVKGGFSFSITKSRETTNSGFNFTSPGSSGFGGLSGKKENAFTGGKVVLPGKGTALFADQDPNASEDAEVDPYFAPVIDLPDLVEVKTGEEGLETIFSHRAKLYRWASDTSEWKERGVGDIKVYKDPKTVDGRVILRREQVHKLACNHGVDPGTILKPNKNSDKSWTWSVMDYADGEAKPEMFAVRFKTAVEASEFKEAYDSFKKAAPTEPKKEEPKEVGKTEQLPKPAPTFGFASQPQKNETPAEMSMRLEREKLAKELTAAASSNKFSFGTSAGSAGDSSKPAPSIFGAAASTSTGFGSSGSAPATSQSFSFGTTSGGGGFSFGTKSGAKLDYSHIGFGHAKDDSVDEDELYGDNSEASDSDDYGTIVYEDREAHTEDVVVQEDVGDECELFRAPTTLPSEHLVQKAKSLGLAETFYNYLDTSAPSESNQFPWDQVDGEMPKPSFNFEKQAPAKHAPGGFNFGTTKSAGFNFGGESGSGTTGGFGGLNKKNFSGFSLQQDGKDAFKNAGQTLFGDTGEDQPQGSDECTATFKPVLDELPPEVDVKTGLEEEEEIFSHRAKLFRFARECTPPEWKERGLGDIKITQNKTTKRFRVVMRREQVLKICANHYITAEMTLKSNNNSDRAWIWTAMDYGDPNEPVGEIQNFCVRFKNSDLANEYKKVFEECQVRLLDQPIGTPARNTSDKISETRVANAEEKVNKMKKEIDFFKHKFDSNEGITLGENGSLTPLVKQHNKEKLDRTKGALPKPEMTKNEDDSENPENEANVSFTPVLEKLPDLIEEKTGEEGETVLFSARGKLYIWKDEQWKERGVGSCKILSKSGVSRIVMRRDQVMKVCLNMPITKDSPDVADKKDANGKAVNFMGMDFSGMATESKDMNKVGEEGVTVSEGGELLNFALRFKLAEIVDHFKVAFTAGIKQEQIEPVFIQKDAPKQLKSPEPVKSPKKEEEEVVDTGPVFSFTGYSAPTSTGFNFGSSAPAAQGFSFGAPAPSASGANQFNFGNK